MVHAPTKSNVISECVCPALTLFLIPFFALVACSLSFPVFEKQLFDRFDKAISTTPGLGLNSKDNALRQLHATDTWSLLNKKNKSLRRWDSELRPLDIPQFFLFKSVALLSWMSVALGLFSFFGIALSAAFPVRSQQTLYTMLCVSWRMIQAVGLIELIMQTTIVISLITLMVLSSQSFAATKVLVLVIGVGIAAIVAVTVAMFKHVDTRHMASGVLLLREDAPQFWDDLERLCLQVGTDPPDQIIVGIEDGFWVTQNPVVLPIDDVMRQTLRGRTLYVSLPLLKILPGQEADAILLHEMAHFSGEDTYFSESLSPLYLKHCTYLAHLEAHWITLPIYHFAMLQLVISRIALGQMRREREFRADRIAAAFSSAEDFAFGLMRVVAFTTYRYQCENDAFYAEAVHKNGSIAQSLNDGFRPFTRTFFDTHPIGDLTITHPFDSHPQIDQRLKSIGIEANLGLLRLAVTDESIGPWYRKIQDADALEASMWGEYEASFRQLHESMLVYRLLPKSEQERTLIEKYFPPQQIYVAYGQILRVDFEKLSFDTWEHAVYFEEIDTMEFVKHGQTWLRIDYRRLGIPMTAKIPLTQNDAYQEAQVREVLESYSNRSDYAHAYDRDQDLIVESNDRSGEPQFIGSFGTK